MLANEARDERSSPMSRHIQVTFDAHDPQALSSFWRDVLGYVHPGPPGVNLLEDADPLAALDDFLARGRRTPRAAQHEIGHRGPGRARPATVLPTGAEQDDHTCSQPAGHEMNSGQRPPLTRRSPAKCALQALPIHSSSPTGNGQATRDAGNAALGTSLFSKRACFKSSTFN
jgi:hypothetical protein